MDFNDIRDAYSPDANEALDIAFKFAKRYRCNYIGSEHIMLGLLNTSNGIAYSVLNSFDIDTEDMIEVFGHMYKNTDRVEQFSFDCINDNNVPAKEIIETIYYALANINVTVVGCLPTDTSWAVKDYCF